MCLKTRSDCKFTSGPEFLPKNNEMKNYNVCMDDSITNSDIYLLCKMKNIK